MKASELRALSNEDLANKLASLKRELSKEKAIVASGTRSEKPSKIRNLRRDIARILTIINERKINEEKKNVKIKEVKR
ncbi:MAG: 50S ribosomal protein L29 [Candidatus Diapherotrites archaeon]